LIHFYKRPSYIDGPDLPGLSVEASMPTAVDLC